MDADGFRSIVGIVILFMGMLHFMERDHGPDERSYFLGGIRLGNGARLAFSVVELVVGTVLVLA